MLCWTFAYDFIIPLGIQINLTNIVQICRQQRSAILFHWLSIVLNLKRFIVKMWRPLWENDAADILGIVFRLFTEKLFRYLNQSKGFTDTFSCGPINMKFIPDKICSISIPTPTDRTDCTVKVIWAELRKSWKCGARQQNCGSCPIMNNDLVKMTVKKVTELIYTNFHQIPSTQFPNRFIQKTVISPHWGRDCCSSGIWNPIEILVWMHLLCSATPTQ